MKRRKSGDMHLNAVDGDLAANLALLQALDLEAETLVKLEVPRRESSGAEEDSSSLLESFVQRRKRRGELARLVVGNGRGGDGVAEPIGEVHDDGDAQGGTVAGEAVKDVDDRVGVEAEAVQGS